MNNTLQNVVVITCCFFVIVTFQSCASIIKHKKLETTLTPQEIEVTKIVNLHPEELQKLKSKPIYQFTPQQLDKYLNYLHTTIPNLRDRVKHIARKNLAQPYRLFLLGEFPFELTDPEPLFNLKESDCVVFAEHTYAMALGWDWASFFAILQRIRYKNGEIGLLTRNHYTELDWNINNSWLLEDITQELAADKAVSVYTEYDKSKFFKKNWGIDVKELKEALTWYYIPYEILPQIIDKLDTGDFVNVVRGYEEPNNKWVSHVGLIIKNEDGSVNFIHSVSPKVKEEPLLMFCKEEVKLNEKRKQYNEIVAIKNLQIQQYNTNLRKKTGGKPHKKEKKLLSKKPYFYGFKFLRLRENPLEELRKIDGDKTPLVIGSQGLYIKKLNSEYQK